MPRKRIPAPSFAHPLPPITLHDLGRDTYSFGVFGRAEEQIINKENTILSNENETQHPVRSMNGDGRFSTENIFESDVMSDVPVDKVDGGRKPLFLSDVVMESTNTVKLYESVHVLEKKMNSVVMNERENNNLLESRVQDESNVCSSVTESNNRNEKKLTKKRKADMQIEKRAELDKKNHFVKINFDSKEELAGSAFRFGAALLGETAPDNGAPEVFNEIKVNLKNEDCIPIPKWKNITDSCSGPTVWRLAVNFSFDAFAFSCLFIAI